jgi:hypothetical protein
MRMRAKNHISVNIASKDLLVHTTAVVMRGTIAFCVLIHLLPLEATVLRMSFLELILFIDWVSPTIAFIEQRRI